MWGLSKMVVWVLDTGQVLGGSPFLASALLPSRTSLVLPVLLFLLPSLPGAQKPHSGSFAASHEVGPLGNMGIL